LSNAKDKGMMPVDVEYEIKPYSHENFAQVVDLLQILWGDNYDANVSYFNWKYNDNPYTEHPLGIVALYNGKVVGFRGYFATKWQGGRKNSKIIVLTPGDTCVHRNHRRQGLSTAMAHRAMEEYQSKYKVFLNLTSNSKSTPGYLKLGFVSLTPKTRVIIFKNKKSLIYISEFLPNKLKNYLKSFGLLKSFLEKRSRLESHDEKDMPGEFDEILVVERPRPERMYNVFSKQKNEKNKIKLMQDMDFFRWRFNNKRNRYLFYFRMKDSLISGYVVVKLSKYNSRVGNIVDYAENDAGSIAKILKYVLEFKHFDILSMYSYGMSDDFLQILKSRPHTKNIVFQKKGIGEKDQLHLLVRPIRKKLFDSDWLIDGRDIKNFENWEIKPICSDAA
jgi:GNAT superfamily N-acetyltransferase